MTAIIPTWPRLCTLAALTALAPASAAADQIYGACVLDVICIDTRPCADWDQSLILTGRILDEGGSSWEGDWLGERVTQYVDLAEIRAPEEAVDPTTLHILYFENTETQSFQMSSLAQTGEIVVNFTQPMLMPRAVTAYGSCEMEFG